jgi:hypothetical protein
MLHAPGLKWLAVTNTYLLYRISDCSRKSRGLYHETYYGLNKFYDTSPMLERERCTEREAHIQNE